MRMGGNIALFFSPFPEIETAIPYSLTLVVLGCCMYRLFPFLLCCFGSSPCFIYVVHFNQDPVYEVQYPMEERKGTNNNPIVPQYILHSSVSPSASNPSILKAKLLFSRPSTTGSMHDDCAVLCIHLVTGNREQQQQKTNTTGPPPVKRYQDPPAVPESRLVLSRVLAFLSVSVEFVSTVLYWQSSSGKTSYIQT
jgi:hypothetical protein